jgi:hypothetical protein
MELRMFDLPANIDFALQPQTAYCLVTAAYRYWLPPEALLAILFTEGGRPGMERSNNNGSSDLGPMQTNTIWLTERSPLYGYVSLATLRDDVCGNIHAAAWIVATNFKRVNDMWKAVGMYHAPYNEQAAANYRAKVNRRVPQARAVLEKNPVYASYVHQFFIAPQVR